MDEAADDAEALTDRLQCLAERRRVAAWRQALLTTSSEGEAHDAPPCRPLLGGALQALREMLQERQTALQTAGVRLVGAGGAASACGQGLVEDPVLAAVAAVTAKEGSPPEVQGLLSQAELLPPSTTAPSASSPPSVPATARAAISLNTAIGQQEAQAEWQALADEAREAEAAVREAEVQRAELEALLLRQEAVDAERRRQRLEQEGELQRVQLEWATQHIAAWRIARAWRRFLRSPSRLQEVVAATSIQAAWRGAASRRRSVVLLQQQREQCALLDELQAAVTACNLVQARQVAGRLGAMACGAPAVQQMAGLERRSAEAAAALSTAAATGTVDDYQVAMDLATQYGHLAEAVQEAAGVFAERLATAEQALAQAVEGGPFALCSEAASAAAALGVSQAVLQRAEQQVVARNHQAAEELQSALDADAFTADVFGSCLQRARQLGLHAAAARAERGLQLRRHRVCVTLQQAAAMGGAVEVEALCRLAAQLGLSEQAGAATARLEQRQAAAAEELRQAAHSGTLQQYQAAMDKAGPLQVTLALQRTCREQLRQRQQAAEQQLRQAADRGELPAIRRRCQSALALGLDGAVTEAERRVNERRMAAAEQLAASTRDACSFATAQADAGQHGGPAAQVLAGSLNDVHQLVSSIAQRGSSAALTHLPPACAGWPVELRGWLVDASRAAGLELERAVGAAAAAFKAQLDALLAATVVLPIPLQPADTPRSSSTDNSSPQQSGGQGQHLQACLRQWQELQHDVLPLVAALAAGEEEESGADSSSGEDRSSGVLDLSGQGLRSLELLSGSSGIAFLDLSGNALTSLEPLRALPGLRELRVSESGLGRLDGVESLSHLTSLDASNNVLERLPSLEALSSLRALDLSGNRLTGGALLAADFPACGARLTALRLGGNRLADVASWMGPLPSLLYLDVSGNDVDSLDGLAAAAPLLQVLVASRNRVATLPPSLHLPLLRELWLGGNRLGRIAAWPWLPSLQLLQLEDNQLAQLAPCQGLHSLRILDLSFNALPSMHAILSSLAPLGGTAGGLQQLRLKDNPLTGGPQQRHAAGQDPGDVAVQSGYRRRVLQALPQLRQLDSQPVGEAERQQHTQAAARRSRAAAGAGARPGVDTVSEDAGVERQARTVLWLLTQPGALELLDESDAQQQAMAAARLFSQAAGRPASVPGAEGLAAALEALEQAAACGSPAGQQHNSGKQAAAPGGGGSRPQGLVQLPLRRAQQVYLLLARDETGAAENVLWLNPEHSREALARLHCSAVCIQTAWRRMCAMRLRQRLAAEQRASVEAAAAVCVQAAWHGWVCRHRSHKHVLVELSAWRRKWREAQRLVMEHERSGAAVSIQAAWRGWRVRHLLAHARQSLWHRNGQDQPGSGGHQADWDLDLELSSASLGDLLEGGASSLARAFEAPETLPAELSGSAEAFATRDSRPEWHHCERPESAGRSTGCSPPAPPVSRASLHLPQLNAAKQAPVALVSTASDWLFDDPATAAAFMQLRQRQVAAVQKRTRQQQRRDPAARLHEFQVRNGLGLPSCPSGICIQQHSSSGSGSRSSGRCGGPGGSCHGSLPSLRSPRVARPARQVMVGLRTLEMDG